MEQQDNLIRRIQKLLAVAALHTDEKESAAAMALVQTILAEYNLDMAIIQDKAKAAGQSVADEKREKTTINRSAMYEWQQSLAKTIAECNFCFYWVREQPNGTAKNGWKTKYVKRHVVLGRESNVMAVTMMLDYLFDTLERLLPYPNTERLSRSAISWRTGAAARLQERIQKQFQESQKRPEPSADVPAGAIVLADVYRTEYTKNYDAHWGEGSYAAAQLRRAEYDNALVERQNAELEARQALEAMLASETPAQRERRLRRQAQDEAKQNAANAKYWERHDRKEQAKSRRTDWSAYAQGEKVGKSINLNKQVDTKTQEKLS